MAEFDTDTRLRELEEGWQELSTEEQRAAVEELDAQRAGLDRASDGPLIDRIEALRADLTLTIGLEPATEEQGFKG